MINLWGVGGGPYLRRGRKHRLRGGSWWHRRVLLRPPGGEVSNRWSDCGTWSLLEHRISSAVAAQPPNLVWLRCGHTCCRPCFIQLIFHSLVIHLLRANEWLSNWAASALKFSLFFFYWTEPYLQWKRGMDAVWGTIWQHWSDCAVLPCGWLSVLAHPWPPDRLRVPARGCKRLIVPIRQLIVELSLFSNVITTSWNTITQQN